MACAAARWYNGDNDAELNKVRFATAGGVEGVVSKFRNRTNGLTTPSGSGLIGALTYFGLDTMGAVEKDELRQLVLRGGPWSASSAHAGNAGCACAA